jgi:hypothetical protein
MSPSGRTDVRPFVFPATVIVAQKLRIPSDTNIAKLTEQLRRHNS